MALCGDHTAKLGSAQSRRLLYGQFLLFSAARATENAAIYITTADPERIPVLRVSGYPMGAVTGARECGVILVRNEGPQLGQDNMW